MNNHGTSPTIKRWGIVLAAFLIGVFLSVLLDGRRASSSNRNNAEDREREIIQSLLRHGSRIQRMELDGKWCKSVILDREWSGTADDISSIAELSNVKCLILNCRLAPDAIDRLSRCRDLSFISASDSGLNDSEIERLHATCPAAEIVHDSDSRARPLIYSDDDFKDGENAETEQ